MYDKRCKVVMHFSVVEFPWHLPEHDCYIQARIPTQRDYETLLIATQGLYSYANTPINHSVIVQNREKCTKRLVHNGEMIFAIANKKINGILAISSTLIAVLTPIIQ
jgi:hypothetical protein